MGPANGHVRVEKLVLQGNAVRLEPLEQQHLDGLAAAILDGDLWTLPVTFVPHPSGLDAFLESANQAFAAGHELAFAVRDLHSARIVGSTRFRCIDPVHQRLEIGFTFVAKSFQRTHVNTESKFLMLRHAFECWQVNRVELLTDARNVASRRAIARLGAKEEGCMRNHMVMRDGFVRDSVIFSITKQEWPQRALALRERIQAKLPQVV